MPAAPARPLLLLVGSGSELRNVRLLRELGERASIVLLQPGPVTWQRSLVRHAEEIDPDDVPSVLATVRRLADALPIEAVVGYDEALLPLVGAITADGRLPGLSAEAAAVVRDKHAQRLRLRGGPPHPPRWRLVSDIAAGERAAEELGYPVVIKPTNLSGSLGIRVVHAPAEFRTLMAATLATGTRGLGPIGAVLVEEFVDGPEFSVDCWVLDGAAGVLFSGLILKGYAPSAINVGCIVGRGIASPEAEAALGEAACAAALKCGVDRTIANVDLRWTGDEARVLEVNGRPAGELLPHLAFLASGVRVGAALADVALGRRPPDPAPAAATAGVAFIAPPEPLAFGALRLSSRCERQAAVRELQATAEPGRRVVPPPDDPWGRVGWAVVTGATADDVRRRLDLVWDEVEVLPHA